MNRPHAPSRGRSCGSPASASVRLSRSIPRRAAAALMLAGTVVLAACGGGDDDHDPPPAASDSVPVSATASVAAWSDFAAAQADSDTAVPLAGVSALVPPTSETDAPLPVRR